MKKALVYGAGLIGCHLFNKLINENYEVIIIRNLLIRRMENIIKIVKFYKLDYLINQN
jgi:nucleoside-diphosphate-sugar epimerase